MHTRYMESYYIWGGLTIFPFGSFQTENTCVSVI